MIWYLEILFIGRLMTEEVISVELINDKNMKLNLKRAFLFRQYCYLHDEIRDYSETFSFFISGFRALGGQFFRERYWSLTQLPG